MKWQIKILGFDFFILLLNSLLVFFRIISRKLGQMTKVQWSIKISRYYLG